MNGIPAVPDPNAPIPHQIRYIIGNEGCERFSFYGMRNILTVFLVTSLLTYLPEADRAKLRALFSHLRGVGLEVPPFARERRAAAAKACSRPTMSSPGLRASKAAASRLMSSSL